MAFSEDGLFGKARGRVGNLVYYIRKGKQVVRSIGINLVPPTDLQLACRMRMSVASAFTKIAKGFINVGFALEAEKQNKMVNTLVNSINKENAVKGEYPNLELDYTKVMVSCGDLPVADNPDVEIVTAGLQFSWTVDEQLAWPDSADQAMLLACFPKEKKVFYSLLAGNRVSGTALLPINQPMLTKRMETYISFMAADGKRIANSVFVKTLNG